MLKQNIICAEGLDLCMICNIGESLEEAETCRFILQKTAEDCPGFICSLQCRYCPKNCEFLYCP